MPVNWKIATGTTTFEIAQSQTSAVSVEHRVWHFIAFGVASWLLLLLASTRSQERKAVLCVMGLGLGIESLQHLLIGNSFEWWDVRDDWASALSIFAVFLWRSEMGKALRRISCARYLSLRS
jgi:hypothetical protein